MLLSQTSHREKVISFSAICLFLLFSITAKAQQHQLRAPAYPLVTVDPNFSIWSFQDTLYNGPTYHWTEKEHSLQGIIRVDGKAMYFMGQPIPRYNTLLPMARNSGKWRFTVSSPKDGWQNIDFDASDWQTGRGAFEDGKDVQNPWNTRDIWARRTFTIKSLDDINTKNLLLNVHHDDDLHVFINGVRAFDKKGVTGSATPVGINPKAREALREGTNVVAAHCINTGGLAYLDVGLLEKVKPKVQVANARQTSVDVTATQTKYSFMAGPVKLNVTFTAPLLLDSLDLVSRPADYLSFSVQSTDGQSHGVQVYVSAASDIAVNSTSQKVVWQRMPSRKLDIMRVGTADQQVLQRKGDNVRKDWGYLYLASADAGGSSSRIASSDNSVQDFVSDGDLNGADAENMPQTVRSEPITLASSFNFGSVSQRPEKHHVILAYNDLYPIEFFHQPLQEWWKKDGESVVGMLERSENQYARLMEATNHFDRQLFSKAKAAGGAKYAELTELAYRQSIAAHKLVIGPDGKPLFFSKENFSNGSIGTVDVTYPSSPLFLYYNPELLKGMLRPIFYYTESGKWTKPFAAHDVGTYPIANGQTYGEDMPVEEAGNMLIMTTAIAEVEGNADFASKHWQALTTWANYLMQNGMDPKNQLSTDDFAGHLAHNANLSIKAILGIAGYGRLARMLGKDEIADKYSSSAKSMAQKWKKMAGAGDHYVLAFGHPDTWSQKYNLAWDDILGLNIFPDDINKTEVAYYLKKQNTYGLPLDNRATYTKSDWINWTATLSNDKATFEKFIAPLYKAFDETKDRVPMTDWYQTTDASQVGFQARSVVGGYFMKMLEEKMKN